MLLLASQDLVVIALAASTDGAPGTPLDHSLWNNRDTQRALALKDAAIALLRDALGEAETDVTALRSALADANELIASLQDQLADAQANCATDAAAGVLAMAFDGMA